MSPMYIGVDIGGTKIYAVEYDAKFRIINDTKIPTESDAGAEKVYQNIFTAIDSVRSNETKAVGISWAGFVDSHNGVVRHAPNIKGFKDFPLTKKLSKDLNIPVWLENDARLFALAENLAEKPHPEVFLGIIIGTGVGAGLIVDGEIFQGSQGMAAEIGHMVVHDKEIESVIGGPAVMAHWQKEIGDHSFAERNEISESNKKSVQKYWQDQIDVFACWLSSLVLAYNPEEIVFGGSTALKFWSYFIDDVEVLMWNKYLKKYPVNFSIRFSELDNAGALGAGILAKNKLNSQ